jgi:hypothetical protein
MTAPQLTRITAQDAENDPPADRTFAERPATTAAHFPRRSYAISVLSPAGYPITITLNDSSIDKLEEALSKLLERGYMPAEVPSVLGPNAPQPAQAQPAGPPTCQYHGPMKESSARPGTWFCPKKMGDGSYCKEKA